ncbi:MAG: transcription elongation factor Spt5 [Candidatus Pacearchaeota archaeon]
MGLNFEDFEYLGEGKEKPEEDKNSSIKEITEEKKIIEIEEKKEELPIEEQKKESFIFVVKVSAGKEKKSFEMISDRIKSKNLEVYSLVRPHGLRGYLIIEAKDKENAEEACYNLPYTKEILSKDLSYDEIRNMVEPAIQEINIEKNDIVEIIGEPFKKEQAKVVRVDKLKGEIVVSLLNAVIPLPVSVKIDNVRVIRKEGEEKS